MDNNEYRSFKILDEISQDINISQRHLAEKLNVSLGLVNSFIKRLVTKGYFKAVSIQKNRVRYILTPEGAVEKTRLTYRYIKHSYELYKSSHHKIQIIFQDLKVKGVERVYFYGATEIAEIAYASLKETDINLAAVIDDQKDGDIFLDQLVTSFKNSGITPSDTLIITAIDSQSTYIDNLLNAGLQPEQIVTFDK